jgi:hypothetical protein
MFSTSGTVGLQSTLNDAFVVAGGSVDVRTFTNGNITVRSTGSGTVSLSSGAGNQFVQVNATGVYASPSLRCPSYLNANTSNSTVTRTGASAIVTTPAQFNTLKIDDVNSAPVTIPIAPLYTGGCVPKFVKLTMSPVTFGSIITGACSVTKPFTIYFYQGSSTSWDVISSQALASFTYTNQVGTIDTVGSYVTIPSVTFPPINGSQIDPAGGPIQVWYYTYFQGFFGPGSGTQTSFTLSVAL